MYFSLWITTFIFHAYILYRYNEYNEYINTFHSTCTYIAVIHNEFLHVGAVVHAHKLHIAHIVSAVFLFLVYLFIYIYIYTAHIVSTIFLFWVDVCVYIYTYILYYIYIYVLWLSATSFLMKGGGVYARKLPITHKTCVSYIFFLMVYASYVHMYIHIYVYTGAVSVPTNYTLLTKCVSDTCIYVYVYKYTYIHINVCIYNFMYIHTYTYIYIHTLVN